MVAKGFETGKRATTGFLFFYKVAVRTIGLCLQAGIGKSITAALDRVRQETEEGLAGMADKVGPVEMVAMAGPVETVAMAGLAEMAVMVGQAERVAMAELAEMAAMVGLAETVAMARLVRLVGLVEEEKMVAEERAVRTTVSMVKTFLTTISAKVDVQGTLAIILVD